MPGEILKFLVNVNKDQGERTKFLSNPKKYLQACGIDFTNAQIFNDIDSLVKTIQKQSKVVGHASIIPDGDPLDVWLKVMTGSNAVQPVDPQVLIT